MQVPRLQSLAVTRTPHLSRNPADCRGIFLDRGELDRLLDAENAWHGGSRDRGEHREPYREPHRERGSDVGAVVNEVLSQVRGSEHGSAGHGYPRRKKESFLGDLFG